MKLVFPYYFAAGLALAMVAPGVAAQVPDPADPAAQVPRASYRSVFADTPTGVETERDDWKKANHEVGQFRRGHVDLLKWEAERGTATPPRQGAGAAGQHQHQHQHSAPTPGERR